MKRFMTTTAIALTLAAGAAHAESHAAAEEVEQNLENAGESLEKAGENAAEATANAANEAGQAVENAASETAEAAEMAAEETEEAMETAAEETEQATTATAEAASDMFENDTNLIRVRDILGGEIYSVNTQQGEAEFSTKNYTAMGEDWENIGEIEDIILTSDGKIRGVVAEIGGFLGIGDKHVMLEMQNVKLVPVEDANYKVVVGYSEEQLEELPSVDESVFN